jgi:hypothetical protein
VSKAIFKKGGLYMKDQEINKFVPIEYNENALSLMVQSPTVLYAYWELSHGLKNTLSRKKKVQIRLNIENDGIGQIYDIDLSEKSYYFNDVQPGLSYNCELGTVDEYDIFLPLLRSNTVNTPRITPSYGSSLPGEAAPTSFSSSAFIRKKD